MADTRTVVVRAIESSLQKDGWRKKSGSWYKRAPETLLVVNIQKSNYSRLYFLNLAIFMPNRADEFSPYEQAPVRLRVNDLPGAEQYSPRELLDLERPLADDERESRITKMMEDLVLPDMNKCGTVDGLMPGGSGRAVIDGVPALGADAMFLKAT